MVSRFVDAVGSVARSAAIPYGYTATLWGTGAATADRLEPPVLLDALGFVAGAWLAFVLVRFVVRRREQRADEPGTRRIVRTGALQIVPVAAAILAASAIGAVTGLTGAFAWLTAGAAATLVFLAVASLDLALVPE